MRGEVMLTGMILLTVRELWAKQIVLGLFILSTIAWMLLSFALNLDIVEGSLAGIRIFGQEAGTPTEATRDDATGELIREALSLESFVVAIEQVVAGAAYWLGTLLGLFATIPLLVGMLERGHVDLLLSKPISRTRLLCGHILGVWLAVLVLGLYLFGMIWLVLSIKTGVWNPSFLASVMVVVCMYAAVYSAAVLVAVATQSTSLSLITTYGLVFISLIFFGKDELVPQINPPWRQVFLGFYHVLPNFAEVTRLAAQLTAAETVTSWYPFISSLLFGLVLYGIALVHFSRRDF
jgi:ABC-type transport system involved in multi-copper enzyme maturation permease subunit